MSWTRASSVPTGGSGPRELRLDPGVQPGHGRERAGHDGRGLWQGDRRALDKGYYPMVAVKGYLGYGGVRRQGLDVSTDPLDLGDGPNPWWSEGVQREFRREAQLAAEQPMWTTNGNEVSLEKPPAIDDADVSWSLCGQWV